MIHLFNNQLPSIQCKEYGQILLPHNLYLVTPLHDLWAPTHSQPHLKSLLPMFPYFNHLLPNLLLKIWRSHLHFPFPANKRTPRCSFTRIFSISMNNLWNLVLNKIRPPGFCSTCKLALLMLGINILCHKSLKKMLSHNMADELLQEIQCWFGDMDKHATMSLKI